jgi:hypothetical protein
VQATAGTARATDEPSGFLVDTARATAGAAHLIARTARGTGDPRLACSDPATRK